MTDPAQKRYTQLLAHLRTQANAFPNAMQRLGDALWNERDDPQAHAECLDLLPQVIDDELAGESITQRYPRVKHHLDRCDTCAQEYAELLDSEWAEQHGTLPVPENIPTPDLTFLPQPKRSLQAAVLDWTRTILGNAEPQTLAMLDSLAKTMFARPRPHIANEARAPYEDSGAAAAVRQTLGASYAATTELVETISRAQFDSWVRLKKVDSEIQTRALAMARGVGMNEEAVAHFARVYAEQINKAPNGLREFLK